jgi:NADH dehydrogenase FAD-containing subunit
MGKHLVLVGGGHAHMTVMIKLAEFVARGHNVTLISSSPLHYYSGMGPGMLSMIYRPEEIRFNVQKMVQDRGATFVEDSVVRVDPEQRLLKLASGGEIGYDVVSFNVGSFVPQNLPMGSTENIFPVKPIINLLEAQRRILDSLSQGKPRIVVMGGGAAGLEVTGNIWRLVHRNGGEARITLFAGRRLMHRFPEKVRYLAIRSLESRHIEVVEGKHVRGIEGNSAHLEGEESVSFDMAFLALGVRPPSLLEESGFPTGSDGGLLVNDFLQSVAFPEVFGGGDCICLQSRPLDKVGVYAVRQNPVLYNNLMAALEDGTMQPFIPGDAYLLIFNLGDGKGIYVKNDWVWGGRLAFHLKDFIDRRFMRKFQISGERHAR